MEVAVLAGRQQQSPIAAHQRLGGTAQSGINLLIPPLKGGIGARSFARPVATVTICKARVGHVSIPLLKPSPMTPPPAVGRRTATLVSPLKSRLFDRARANDSPDSAPGLHGWWLRGCGSSAFALASFLLLPLAASAVPMAPLIPATPGAAAPAGAPSGMNGPRRPGVIPHPSLSRGGGSADGLPQAPRRPVPGQNVVLAANR